MSRQGSSRSRNRTPAVSSLSQGGILQRKCGCGKQTTGGGTCGQCQRKQKSVGHAGVKALPVQTKLTIGQPGDKYEQEADRIAEKVMRMPEPQVQRQMEDDDEVIRPKRIAEQITPLVQRQMDEDEETIQAKLVGNSILPLVQRQMDEEDIIQPQRFSLAGQGVSQVQRQMDEEEETGLVQRKEMPGQASTVAPEVATRIQGLRGGGQPLSKETRDFFEPRFGYDFSRVQIHSDSKSTDKLKASAYTVGTDIVFTPGLYNPNSTVGKYLLAHELVHVIQQESKQTKFLTEYQSLPHKKTQIAAKLGSHFSINLSVDSSALPQRIRVSQQYRQTSGTPCKLKSAPQKLARSTISPLGMRPSALQRQHKEDHFLNAIDKMISDYEDPKESYPARDVKNAPKNAPATPEEARRRLDKTFARALAPKEPFEWHEEGRYLNKDTADKAKERNWLYKYLRLHGWNIFWNDTAKKVVEGSLNPVRAKIVAIALGEVGAVETAVFKEVDRDVKEVEQKHRDGSPKPYRVKRERLGAQRLYEYFKDTAPGMISPAIFDWDIPLQNAKPNAKGARGGVLNKWCGIFALWAHRAAGNTTAIWHQGGKGLPWKPACDEKKETCTAMSADSSASVPSKRKKYEVVPIPKKGNPKELPKPGDIVHNGNHHAIVIKVNRSSDTTEPRDKSMAESPKKSSGNITLITVDGNHPPLRGILLRTTSIKSWMAFIRAADYPN